MKLLPQIVFLLLMHASNIHCRNQTPDFFDVNVSSSYQTQPNTTQKVQERSAKAEDQQAVPSNNQIIYDEAQSYLVHEPLEADTPFLPTPQPYVFDPEPPQQEETYPDDLKSGSLDQSPSLGQIQNVLNGVNADDYNHQVPKTTKILEIIRVPAVYELHMESDTAKMHLNQNFLKQGLMLSGGASLKPLSQQEYESFQHVPSMAQAGESQTGAEQAYYKDNANQQRYPPYFDVKPEQSSFRQQFPKSGKGTNKYQNQRPPTKFRAQSSRFSSRPQTNGFMNYNSNFGNGYQHQAGESKMVVYTVKGDALEQKMEKPSTGEYYSSKNRGTTKYVHTLGENRNQGAPKMSYYQKSQTSKIMPKPKAISKPKTIYQKPKPEYTFDKQPTVNDQRVYYKPNQVAHYFEQKEKPVLNLGYEKVYKQKQWNLPTAQNYEAQSAPIPVYYHVREATTPTYGASNQKLPWDTQLSSNYFSNFNNEKPQAIHEVPAPVFKGSASYQPQNQVPDDKIIYGKYYDPHNLPKTWQQDATPPQHVQYIQGPTNEGKPETNSVHNPSSEQAYRNYNKGQVEPVGFRFQKQQTKEIQPETDQQEQYNDKDYQEAVNNDHFADELTKLINEAENQKSYASTPEAAQNYGDFYATEAPKYEENQKQNYEDVQIVFAKRANEEEAGAYKGFSSA